MRRAPLSWGAVLFGTAALVSGFVTTWVAGAAACRWADLNEGYALAFPILMLSALGLSWSLEDHR